MPGGQTDFAVVLPPGFFFRMNKIPPSASNYRESNTLYRGTKCQDYVARSVVPDSAISDIPRISGFAALAASFLACWSKSSKQSKIAIESHNSHNLGFCYLTHTLFGVIYMLSEVAKMGNSRLESHFCADLGHCSDASHTHNLSLFLPTHEIDATIGSFASRTLTKKDVFYDPLRKPLHLEIAKRTPLETCGLSDCNRGRSPERRKAIRPHLCHFQDFRPNQSNSRTSVRMAGKETKNESRRSGKVATLMNENECLICQQPKDNHDPMVCDAVRMVLNQRIKRAEAA